SVPPALVIGRDFPDPEVIEFGGTYYAYSTSSSAGRVPYATAPGPTGPWTVRGDALPQRPSWAGGGGFWAPDVSRRADGRFLMYFTGPSVATGRMCLGAALASAPTGPFQPTSGQPLVCDAGEGGDIDPSSFVDTNGARYLLYKNDGNAIGRPTIIWLQPTAADGVTFTGGRVELLRNNRPEDQGVIEAPVLVKRPSRYVLFYSAGVYTTGNYTVYIGYAAGFGDAQHTLTVNGAAPRVVTYPNRGWDNWTQVSVEVNLTAGNNTIRLQHLSRWAELDYLEVA
ncbi:MAG: family 43 glycosylhydrolase, partial [Pseudonocardiaceae bacterium]|nr:family 43 glycosylhydrolase [Pseudonocardiaceae bacterium]